MAALPHNRMLAQIQRGFADAILCDDAPIPWSIRAASGPASASRFGVYRNNVIAGLTKALAARYPLVRKLLWDDGFARAARLYVTIEPPRSPVLLEYGDRFPQFLRSIGRGCAADYVADIAALEAARTRAYHAADAVPVEREAFAALPADRLADLRLSLHPSLTLLKSRFPVISVWEANLSDSDNLIREWTPESALVARPDADVEVRRLPPGGYEFFSALSHGRAVGSAVAHATTAAPGFDLEQAFAVLIAARVVVGFEPLDAVASDAIN